MSSVNDAVNSITNLFESGDIRLVVDIALIAMVVWFVIRGVNRLFETLVLGGITVYAVYHILQYLGIEVDYQNLVVTAVVLPAATDNLCQQLFTEVKLIWKQ